MHRTAASKRGVGTLGLSTPRSRQHPVRHTPPPGISVGVVPESRPVRRLLATTLHADRASGALSTLVASADWRRPPPHDRFGEIQIAADPPSTGSVTPVMNRASSEARNSSALETSAGSTQGSGSASRVDDASANSSKVGFSRSGAEEFPNGVVLDHVGVAVRGCHDIHADGMRCKFHGECAHESDDAVFGRHIVAESGEPLDAGVR